MESNERSNKQLSREAVKKKKKGKKKEKEELMMLQMQGMLGEKSAAIIWRLLERAELLKIKHSSAREKEEDVN